MRGDRLLSLAGWTLITACAGDGNETRSAGSAGSGSSPETAPSVPAPAQSQSFSRGTVPMKIVARVAGKTYRSGGLGECASSADASIYEVPATLWHAIYDGDGSEIQNLNLTVWRPKAGGGNMVGLSLGIGQATHQLATVKGGRMAGSGTAGVSSAGTGGTLTATGKDDHGDAIEVSVECERFDEVVAEGG